jgi:hypothetical protein
MTMKRVIAITAVVVTASAHLASAQSTTTSTSASIADVAKAEEARRKSVRKPAKVYTNGDLRTDVSPGVPAPAPAAPGSTTPTTGDNKTPGAPATPAAPKGAGQEYWAARMKAAQDQVARTQIFMDSLQSRINALTTDFVNRDDPAQRAKIEGDRLAALAELERVKKELAEQTKAIKTIEEEARRAGAPPGWLRPGA